MGKLHSLRKAIEKDPEAWFDHNSGRAMTAMSPRAWTKYQWKPVHWHYWSNHRSYRSFVKHVLHDLGYVCK